MNELELREMLANVKRHIVKALRKNKQNVSADSVEALTVEEIAAQIES